MEVEDSMSAGTNNALPRYARTAMTFDEKFQKVTVHFSLLVKRLGAINIYALY